MDNALFSREIQGLIAKLTHVFVAIGGVTAVLELSAAQPTVKDAPRGATR
jgi:hypothetical protein